MASSYKSLKKIITFIELEGHDYTRDFSELKKVKLIFIKSILR